MSWLKNLLDKRKVNSGQVNSISPDKSANMTKKGWDLDRYQSVLVQRNILFLLIILMTGIVFISVFVVGNISSKYKVEPFVINIEKNTGITTVVNPLSHRELLTNESLNRYFIIKYLKARETYNDVTYSYNYNTVVRLYSDNQVWGEFRRFISYSPDSPILKYGMITSTVFRLRSFQFIDDPSGKKAVVRFAIDSDQGRTVRTNKIATIRFTYTQMDLDFEDRSENPLGFQVTGYRVDEDLT